MMTIEELESKVQLLNDELVKLQAYTTKVNEIPNITKMNVALYLRDFIIAFDMTNAALSTIIELNVKVESMLDNAESISFLENASVYLASKGMKENVESHKQYVNMDQHVIRVKDLLSRTEALISFLKNKLEVFRFSHDAAKKCGFAWQSPFEGS